MKKILLVILTLSFTAKIYSQEPLQKFNEILGEEKAVAFDQAVESYLKFLELNYSGQKSRIDQNSQFLKDIQGAYKSGPPDWKFPDDNNSVLALWEESGLRKEIRLWPNEYYVPSHLPEWGENSFADSLPIELEEEIIPITPRDGQFEIEPMERDSFLMSNTFGKYLYALEQCCASDPLVYDYVEVKHSVGDISPSLMAGAFSTFGEKLNDHIVLRMIVAELYYWFMLSELEKEE